MWNNQLLTIGYISFNLGWNGLTFVVSKLSSKVSTDFTMVTTKCQHYIRHCSLVFCYVIAVPVVVLVQELKGTLQKKIFMSFNKEN